MDRRARIWAVLPGRRWLPRSCARAGRCWSCASCCAARTRFNDLRRGVPRMSPALLSKRLKELGARRRRHRRARRQRRSSNIACRKPARTCAAVIMGMGFWGQRWVESRAVAAQSRSVPADVGHAAQPQSRAAAATALHDTVSVPGDCAAPSRIGGWWWKAKRSISAASTRLRGRPSGDQLAAQHDRDLDGRQPRPARDRRRQSGARG